MDLLSRIQNRLTPMDPIPTGMEPAGTVLAGVRAVIFDVYGTLFTSGSGDIGVAAATDSGLALPCLTGRNGAGRRRPKRRERPEPAASSPPRMSMQQRFNCKPSCGR